MVRTVTAFLLLVPCVQAAWAQPYGLNSERWYPLETGNYWVYRNVYISVDYGSRHVIATTRDTVVASHRWTLFDLIYSTLPPDRAYAAAPLGWQRFSDDFYLLRTRDFVQVDTLWKTVPRSFFAVDTPVDSTLDVVVRHPGQTEWHREPAFVRIDTTYYRDERCCRPDSTNFILGAELWQGTHSIYGVGLVYNIGHVNSGEVHHDELEGALVDGRAYGDTTLINSVVLPVEARHEMPQVAPGLAVYPNPATGPLRIRVDAAVSGRHEVRMFNMLGQQVYHASRWMPLGGRVLMDVAPQDLDLASGLYVVRVRDEGGRTAGARVMVIR